MTLRPLPQIDAEEGATNPFDDPQIAARYEAWYTGRGRRADRLEKQLLRELLADYPVARKILDVGCGTGHFTRWFATQGLDATGLDISRPMIAEAQRLGGAAFVEGDAMQLPFGEDTFDLVTMITTLEFVSDPERALSEAVRIARRGLILGVLNRHSLYAALHGKSDSEVWRAARFFTVSELKSLARLAGGSRLGALRCRTTLWPVPCVGSLSFPWGGFIGMSVKLLQRNLPQK